MWTNLKNTYFPNIKLFLPLQFAYHDNKRNPRLYTDKKGAELLVQTVKCLAYRFRIKTILLTSYNEHYEGHATEPTVQYNNIWLQLVKQYFKNNPALKKEDIDKRIWKAVFESP